MRYAMPTRQKVTKVHGDEIVTTQATHFIDGMESVVFTKNGRSSVLPYPTTDETFIDHHNRVVEYWRNLPGDARRAYVR